MNLEDDILLFNPYIPKPMGDRQQFSEGGLLFLLPPGIASAPNDRFDTTVCWQNKLSFNPILFNILKFRAKTMHQIKRIQLGVANWHTLELKRVNIF